MHYQTMYGAPFVSKLGKMVWYIKEDGGIYMLGYNYTPLGVYIPTAWAEKQGMDGLKCIM